MKSSSTLTLALITIATAYFLSSKKSEPSNKSAYKNGFKFANNCKDIIIDNKTMASNYFYGLGKGKKLEEFKSLCDWKALNPTNKNYENLYNIVIINFFKGFYEITEDKFIILIALTYYYLILFAFSLEENLKLKLIYPYNISYLKNINNCFKIINNEIEILNFDNCTNYFREIGKRTIFVTKLLEKLNENKNLTEDLLLGIFTILVYEPNKITIYVEDYYTFIRAYFQGCIDAKTISEKRANEILVEILEEDKKAGIDTKNYPKNVW